MRPPWGVNLIAFVSRFEMARVEAVVAPEDDGWFSTSTSIVMSLMRA